MHELNSQKSTVGGNLCINLELGIAPLVNSVRDGPIDSSHGRKGSMMIENGTYGSRGWQIMVELNQAHIKGEISSTMWQCDQLGDCP